MAKDMENVAQDAAEQSEKKEFKEITLKFGKGMWGKLPAEGSTTVRKDNVVGQDEAGKNVYETTKTKVPNTELKAMVEFYKTQDRSQEQGQETPKDAEKTKEKAPKAKSKGQKI